MNTQLIWHGSQAKGERLQVPVGRYSFQPSWYSRRIPDRMNHKNRPWRKRLSPGGSLPAESECLKNWERGDLDGRSAEIHLYPLLMSTELPVTFSTAALRTLCASLLKEHQATWLVYFQIAEHTVCYWWLAGELVIYRQGLWGLRSSNFDLHT